MLPTQYAAQQIKASLVSFRRWEWRSIRLVTGVDKEDPHANRHTRLTITTYGMLWRWLTSVDPAGHSNSSTDILRSCSMNCRDVTTPGQGP